MIIGNQTLGSAAVQFPPGDNKAANRFQNTNGSAVAVTTVKGNWDVPNSTAKARAVLYADDNGKPGALLAQSSEKVGIVYGWNTFTLPSTTIAAGAYVWIGVIADTMLNCQSCQVGGAIYYNADTYADGPSSTFGAEQIAAYTYPLYAEGDAPVTEATPAPVPVSAWGAWLRDPAALRCLLFEVGVNVNGVETTRYFSTLGYTTKASETPASTAYPAIASGQGLAITESLSLDGSGALTVGDIQITNVAGERDSWLLDVWTNRPVNVYLGDVRWARADYQLVFSGVVADIGSQDRDTLNLILANKLQRLNTAVSDVRLGGEATFSQAGTTVTVTKPAHNRKVGSPVVVAPFSSGTTVTAGTYQITDAPTPDTFTYTAPDTRTVSGRLLLVGVNYDALIPITLGECHNITPLLIDGAALRYASHLGVCERQFEVRDNGKPVGVFAMNNAGYFELAASPAGAITVSIMGDKASGYTNTVTGLTRRLATGYGVPANRFTDADLDGASLGAFDAAHAQPVGIYLSQRTNVLAAVQELCASIGAQPVITRLGKLRLVQLSFPPAGTPVAIPRSDQIDRTLQIVGRSTVQAAVKLNYVRNWTVQPGLQTSIPAEHKEMFASEWWSVSAVDATVAARYQLTGEPQAQNTYLLTKEDAQLEADRRLAIVKQPRTSYRFEGTAAHLELELGQAVTLYSDRFGLSAGALGVVTSLSPDWQTCQVAVEVTI